ncbi:hypothetical protein Tco_0003823 [Tanacetum coccineum]
MNIFEGIKVGSSGVDVSHFQFADDALIIGKWSHENTKNLCRILRCLELSSGLKVNFSKRKFFGLGASMAKTKTLSYGGRLTLWKSVLGSLGIYFFWLFEAPKKGADDEEISKGGILWVIVLGYDGLPMQPVAPPSPDYIPGPEDPQTPPVPQDEDKREPMLLLAEEQPLPPVDSPTAESPGYVTKSDPEEDPEEYKDDETEDGPVDYPIDRGDDRDDDDDDSSRDDANDEDEDEDKEDKEEEEEHLAPADSAVVVPTNEPVSSPEGTKLVIPPPSTDITIGARILV